MSGGLVFRLAPDTYGWTIGVIAAGRPDEDFAGIATPPYRGINARYLEGWHFRNGANTGPNTGDVNAPQHEREFAFVLSANDYHRASQVLDALLWGARPEAERQQLFEILSQVSRGRGRLRVKSSSLGNLQPGTQAWAGAREPKPERRAVLALPQHRPPVLADVEADVQGHAVGAQRAELHGAAADLPVQQRHRGFAEPAPPGGLQCALEALAILRQHEREGAHGAAVALAGPPPADVSRRPGLDRLAAREQEGGGAKQQRAAHQNAPNFS